MTPEEAIYRHWCQCQSLVELVPETNVATAWYTQAELPRVAIRRKRSQPLLFTSADKVLQKLTLQFVIEAATVDYALRIAASVGENYSGQRFDLNAGGAIFGVRFGGMQVAQKGGHSRITVTFVCLALLSPGV